MVTLRMFTEAELDWFDTGNEASDDPYGFFGFRTSRAVREAFAAGTMVRPEQGSLAVEVDGAVIGEVQWHAVHYGPPPGVATLNIGIKLTLEARGHGHGAAAQTALADYLFRTYPINRIEASTDVTNLAEQRALAKAGFTREGTVRGAQWRAGRCHDLIVYSRLRNDPTLAEIAKRRREPDVLGRLHHTVLDCRDPLAEAQFWSRVLGQPITHRSEDFVVVAPSDRASGLGFQRSPGHVPPQWPGDDGAQQLHLDVMVEHVARAGELVVSLGATLLAGDVYADPAGHPFCLVTRPYWAEPLV